MSDEYRVLALDSFVLVAAVRHAVTCPCLAADVARTVAYLANELPESARDAILEEIEDAANLTEPGEWERAADALRNELPIHDEEGWLPSGYGL